MKRSEELFLNLHTPDFVMKSLTLNVLFYVKSHDTKHIFWESLILKSQHLTQPIMTWNDTSFKKLDDCYHFCSRTAKLCTGVCLFHSLKELC